MGTVHTVMLYVSSNFAFGLTSKNMDAGYVLVRDSARKLYRLALKTVKESEKHAFLNAPTTAYTPMRLQ